jgi:hypothetical protein
MAYKSFFLTASKLYVGFASVAGFLFGQLFFGTFKWDATATGVAGLLVAIVTFGPSKPATKELKRTLIVCTAVALVGLLSSAAHYYKFNIYPGNNFGWSLKIPYILGIIYITYSSLITSNNSN